MNLNPGLWIFVESGTQFSSKSNKLQTPCQSSSKELNKQHLCKFSKTHNQFKQTTNVTDEYTPIWIWIEYTNPSSPCPNRITLQQCKENRRTKCYEVEKAVNIASGCTQNHNQVYCFTERMATSCVVHLGWKKKSPSVVDTTKALIQKFIWMKDDGNGPKGQTTGKNMTKYLIIITLRSRYWCTQSHNRNNSESYHFYWMNNVRRITTRIYRNRFILAFSFDLASPWELVT